MRPVKYFITLLFLVLTAVFPVFAQNLPVIPRSSAVKVGMLPSNVRYYLAPGNTSKGYANFVLVQKGKASSDASRSLLLKLEHFRKKAPYRFLASKGVGYGPDGFISHPDGNTVFRFNDVPTFDKEAADSTILLIFDLIRSCEGEQAIVVAGDFNQSELESKLYLFSLTVTPRRPVASRPRYEWKPEYGPAFIHTENNTRKIAGITLSWNSPRTPYGRLLTAQPLVSRMYASQLGRVLERRIQRRFIKDGIPLAGFTPRYLDSSCSAGDERYEFTVNFSIDDLDAATAAIAEVFSSLDSFGATAAELTDARMEVLAAMERALSLPSGNAAMADECVSSFLYGTNIVSPDEIRSFFTRRQMSPEQDLKLFNGFVSALFDPRRALSIRCDTPQGELDGNAFLERFMNAWEAAPLGVDSPAVSVPSLGDTITLLHPGKEKVSLKSTTLDPVTGGSIWTFSNGTRVIYKQTSRKGMIDYGLLLKGGYSYVPEIGPGESAFVGDVMGLCRISGKSALDFSDMIAANGIEMQCEATLTDMKVTGQAPADKLELLLRVLLSYSRDRRPDSTAFSYYRACEALRQERARQSRMGIIAAIDSTMSPYYYYPSTKNVARLRDDLPQRVDRYLDAEFAKFNDGLLVILGDVPAAHLQKTLCRYLGAFSVSPSFSVRPKVEYGIRPGWSTYTVEASHSSIGSGEVCVNVGMATSQPFTIRSYSAFMIAALAMKGAITEALAPVGMYAEVTVDAQVFPSERLAMYVTCRPCAEDGLPVGVIPAEPIEVLRALRLGISRVSGGKLTPNDLKVLKQALLGHRESSISDPSFLIRAVMMRNSECKDIVSDYQAAIESVTLGDVNSIVHDLDYGSKVEYIIR